MRSMEGMKTVREAATMSVKELAEAAGVHRSYVYMLESGDRTNPSRDVLLRLAKALDVPLYVIAN
jgi:transcriptional regulator with XRE-family HTH domain